ncbi:Asp-tRNA(Asn)/Glu-tRNA(Gln) amidotransferase subunit GatB [bacterium]|nr:Asp-tRNA(Asn)/Glu-tRNA(Gln) amidotransferase subunit GatB [bacterium]
MKKDVFPVLGVEVHIQVKSDRKIFCNCKNTFGAAPNSHICPICTGQPGTLPVFNRNILTSALNLSLALNCRINLFTGFDRKNYFYPDTPKNYQITQNEFPIGYDGNFFFFSPENTYSLGISRVHMEEDSAKLVHKEDSLEKGSTIDYNRSGIPLLEVVTEPEFHDSDSVVYFLEFLKRTAQYLGISECNMEEGSLRVDTNISLTHDLAVLPDYRVEIKNMNTFSGVRSAIEYEIERQKALFDRDLVPESETRNWDSKAKKTRTMRKKESFNDYRYFPEPDIPPILLSEKNLFALKDNLPLTPGFAMNQLTFNFRLRKEDAYVLSSEKAMYLYFIEASKYCVQYEQMVNWITGDVIHYLRERGEGFEDCKLPPKAFADIVKRIGTGKLTGKIFKSILERLLSGEDFNEILENENISVISDRNELKEIAEKILSENPAQVKLYIGGKTGLIGFFMGMMMKVTDGRCDPKLSQQIFEELLDK